MRGIIYKDVCLFFRALDRWGLLICAGAVAILVGKYGAYAGLLASVMLAVMVGLMNVMVFEKEEKTEWGKYQRILPLGCREVVAGKYTAVLLTSVVGLTVSLAFNLILFAVYRTFLLPVLGLSALLMLVIPVIWTALSLPLCYWFGHQISQYASMILVFPLSIIVRNYEDGLWTVPDLASFIGGNLHGYWLLGLLALAGVFLLSLAVSAAGYCRRGR